MLKSLFNGKTEAFSQFAEALKVTRFGLAKDRYEEWRRSQDMVTIMAAFYKLSDRHLAMIGMDRDEIYYIVAEMMAQAEERKQIAADVAKMLEETPEPGVTPNLEERAKDDAEVAEGAQEAADGKAIAA